MLFEVFVHTIFSCAVYVQKDEATGDSKVDNKMLPRVHLVKGAKVGPVVEPAARVPMQTTPLHERLLRKFQNSPTNIADRAHRHQGGAGFGRAPGRRQ